MAIVACLFLFINMGAVLARSSSWYREAVSCVVVDETHYTDTQYGLKREESRKTTLDFIFQIFRD